MTTYRGNAGLLKVGGTPTVVAELTGFTIQATMGKMVDTAQGDTAETYLSEGIQRWSGTMKGHYDPSDTNGQATVVEGASLAMVALPMGTTTGLQKLSGTVHIDSVDITSENANVVSFSAAFTGNGALTRGTN